MEGGASLSQANNNNNAMADSSLIRDLFDLCCDRADNTLGKDDAMELLRRVHTHASMTESEAADLFHQVDKANRGKLRAEEFGVFLRSACFNMPADVFSESLRAQVHARRQAYRRRYLMFNADATALPRAITDNTTIMKMYHDIFSAVDPNKSGFATKDDLRSLLHQCAPEHRKEIDDMMRAADVNVRGEVSFNEFVLVLRGARLSVSLSDMARIALRDINYQAVHSGSTPAQKRTMDLERLKSEVLQYRQFNEEASRKTEQSLKMSTVELAGLDSDLEHVYGHYKTDNTTAASDIVPDAFRQGNTSTLIFGESSTPSDANMKLGILERENEKLKSEIDVLRAKLSGYESGEDLTQASMKEILKEKRDAARMPPTAEGYLHTTSAETEVRRLKLLLAMGRESSEWVLLQREGHAVLSNETESELTMRHQMLRDAVLKLSKEDLASAAGMNTLEALFNQYEYIVMSYRNLWADSTKTNQELRKLGVDRLNSNNDGSGGGGAPQPIPMVVSVQPKYQPVPSPSSERAASRSRSNVVPLRGNNPQRQQQATFRAPSSGRGGSVQRRRTDSPMRTAAGHSSIFSSPRRADLDVTPTPSAKGQRTLEDPLLTPDERADLRSKIAAQMRNAARHYESPNKDTRSTYSPRISPVVPGRESSHDSMTRLAELTDWRNNRRQFGQN
eukprot:PhM_4_TR17985/c0_g1_i1/m.80979